MLQRNSHHHRRGGLLLFAVILIIGLALLTIQTHAAVTECPNTRADPSTDCTTCLYEGANFADGCNSCLDPTYTGYDCKFCSSGERFDPNDCTRCAADYTQLSTESGCRRCIGFPNRDPLNCAVDSTDPLDSGITPTLNIANDFFPPVPRLMDNDGKQLPIKPIFRHFTSGGVSIEYNPHPDMYDMIKVELWWQPSAPNSEPVFIQDITPDGSYLSDFTSPHLFQMPIKLGMKNAFLRFQRWWVATSFVMDEQSIMIDDEVLTPQQQSTTSSSTSLFNPLADGLQPLSHTDSVYFDIAAECQGLYEVATDIYSWKSYGDWCETFKDPQVVCHPALNMCLYPNSIPTPDTCGKICNLDNTKFCGSTIDEPCICKEGFGGFGCETTTQCSLQNTEDNACVESNGYLKFLTETNTCDTTCTCYNENLVGPRCEFCQIECANDGKPRRGCNGCYCPAGFTGDRCDCPSVRGTITITGTATTYAKLLFASQGRLSTQKEGELFRVDHTMHIQRANKDTPKPAEFSFSPLPVNAEPSDGELFSTLELLHRNLGLDLTGSENGHFGLSMEPLSINEVDGTSQMVIRFHFDIPYGCVAHNGDLNLDSIQDHWEVVTAQIHNYEGIKTLFTSAQESKAEELAPSPAEPEDPFQTEELEKPDPASAISVGTGVVFLSAVLGAYLF